MIIFDTETTGLPLPGVADLDKQPRIIDFAVIKIAPAATTARGGKKAKSAWREVDRLEFLCDPQRPLEAEITKITGYRDEDVRGQPVFADNLPRVVDFFLGERSIVAHNLPFDHSLLLFELQRIGRAHAFPWPPVQICTAALSEEKYGKRLKLIQLYEKELGRPLAQKHTAMADVEALLEVVMAMKVYDLEAVL